MTWRCQRELIARASVQCTLVLQIDFAQDSSIPRSLRATTSHFWEDPLWVSLFAVCIDRIGFIYVTPEGLQPSEGMKTADGVISCLDHALQGHSDGACFLHIQADNCVPQNKNTAMLAYLAYLIAAGRFQHITLSFQLAGHGKCLCDAFFGLLKRLLDCMDVDTLLAFIACVLRSSRNTVPVQMPPSCWRDWRAFSEFTCMSPDGLTAARVFEFDVACPGMVGIRNGSSSAELQWRRLWKKQRVVKEPAVFTKTQVQRGLTKQEVLALNPVQNAAFALTPAGLSPKRVDDIRQNIVSLVPVGSGSAVHNQRRQWWAEFLQTCSGHHLLLDGARAARTAARAELKAASEAVEKSALERANSARTVADARTAGIEEGARTAAAAGAADSAAANVSDGAAATEHQMDSASAAPQAVVAARAVSRRRTRAEAGTQ